MIARPESGGPHPIPGGQKDALVKGAVRSNTFSVSAPFSFLHIFIKVVDELVRTYSDWVMLVIRLYHETQVTLQCWLLLG